MGVPARFAIEYPQRALELIGLLEEQARKRELLGSFGLLAAAAILTIPYERMKTSHFLHREERDHDLASNLKRLDKVGFLAAPFWQAQHDVDAWWQSRIMASVDEVEQWRDELGNHPLTKEANTIARRNAGEVIRVLRNALAHGNIIYLDKDGREIAGNVMIYMAFLSRYEETAEQRDKAETYRVVVTTEDAFLRFVKAWARWVSGFPLNDRVAEAA
jgi:hypothetical protein